MIYTHVGVGFSVLFFVGLASAAMRSKIDSALFCFTSGVYLSATMYGKNFCRVVEKVSPSGREPLRQLSRFRFSNKPGFSELWFGTNARARYTR